MEQNEGKKQFSIHPKWQLALALAATALLAVVVTSLAWLNSQRSLQTITRMQMPILFLKDTEISDTAVIDVGNLNISTKNSKEIPFAVIATERTSYNLQIAHTTNIDLKYSLYRANDAGNYDEATPIMLDTIEKNSDTIQFSYGGYTYVENDAKPVYLVTHEPTDIYKYGPLLHPPHYYVLKIQWNGDQVLYNKESEMIYLTVSTDLNENTATAPSTESAGGNE